MNRLTPLFLLLLLALSCQKTQIDFTSSANENLDLPLLLNLDEKNCVFDVDHKLLKYSIKENALEDYEPLIQFQSHSSITFNGIELTNNTTNNLGDLELNKLYPVRVKTNNETNEFSLQFTNIPIVQIITHDPIINGPKTLTRLIINHPLQDKISDNNWAGIEQRGRSSLAYDKKSYGIEIVEGKSTDHSMSRPYFDFKSNKKWILDALFIDQSRLRNKTSFDLWNSMTGVTEHIGIEMRFVEVFINHQAQGVYSFTESFTVEFLDLNTESVFYKGIDNSHYTYFDSVPEDAPNSGQWSDWEQEIPKPSQTINWDDFEALCQLVVNGSDSDFKNNIGVLLDLDNVIDYFLFINVCGGLDNVAKNWYFLKIDKSSKFIIVPWDMDATWGRGPFAQELGYDKLATNNLFRRLQAINPDNYVERLKERWLNLRAAEFSETAINALLEANFSDLKSYEIIDFENKLWGTSLNLDLEQVYISNWLSYRLNYLDNYLD